MQAFRRRVRRISWEEVRQEVDLGVQKWAVSKYSSSITRIIASSLWVQATTSSLCGRLLRTDGGFKCKTKQIFINVI